jgi:serine/threonine protein kinase
MISPDTILRDRYRIVQQLGQGGMGTVYEAVDQVFDNTVAVKVTYLKDERLHRQFEVEARLLNKLRHPALPRVIDKFSEDDGKFLVMDFIEGEDLFEKLEKRGEGFPLEEVLTWADQLLDALDYLHTRQPPIIHRDIKLQNLKLAADGQIILLDFGLAKGIWEQTIITTRTVVGFSFAYSPLEQFLQVDRQWIDLLSVANAELVSNILKRGTDERTDLYSLGATLLHLITAKTPPAAPVRALSVWSGSIDPLLAMFNERVPQSIVETLQKSMQLDPAERMISATEMRKTLQEAKKSLHKVDPPPIKTIPAPAPEPFIPPSLSPPPASTSVPLPNYLIWISGGVVIFILIGIMLVAMATRNTNTNNAASTNTNSSGNNVNIGATATTIHNENAAQSPTPIQTPSPTSTPAKLVAVNLFIDYDNTTETIKVTLKSERGTTRTADPDNGNPIVFRNIPCGQRIRLSATYSYQLGVAKPMGEFKTYNLDCDKSTVDLGRYTINFDGSNYYLTQY